MLQAEEVTNYTYGLSLKPFWKTKLWLLKKTLFDSSDKGYINKSLV